MDQPPRHGPYRQQWGPRPHGRPRRPGRVIGSAVYLGALAIGLVIAVGAYFMFSTGTPEAGRCVDVVDAETASPSWELAACGSPESDFTIAEVIAGSARCPDVYATLSQRSGTRLCLVPDVAAGDCLNIPLGVGVETKVPCSDSDAAAQVTTVAHDARGEADCAPDSEQYTVYPEPATTICTRRPSQ
ncbi:LppU/SCO3897 family protein [Saccharopolyspora rosea]|uniref:Uncharacterized protein n=1 Tax=Saccharopolyspora rosea TaxID=524884 RepID=A0ABW3FK99_9PSEU|nr:hypothetical protein [Saccharopolyspora rosea]